MIIGCHLSTGAGFSRAVDNAGRLGADAFQYFPKNPRSYRIKAVDRHAWEKEGRLARERGLVTVGHSAYVTNLSTADPALRETTIASIVNELEICEAYGTPWLVVHCGRHMGEGWEIGRRRMVEAVDEVMRRFQGRCQLLLENTAGQGSEIGRTVDELLSIHEALESRRRVGFCLDSCHAFASGMLEPGAYERFAAEVRRPEFAGYLRVVHFNDSKGGAGEQVDRHALLGQGRMGALLVEMLRDPFFQALPVIIETPVAQEDDYAAEIEKARRWAMGEDSHQEGGEAAPLVATGQGRKTEQTGAKPSRAKKPGRKPAGG
ncbi:deoxyribonuclease IV [Carboxydochorda subterranea]|uniref:Probable endonuclease 4 n=1 Tax=Carboxydichorda subterranea TaxID=3109565 RepID=A0ABZ1BUV5_9FIRM|nr:deoxyribonuclease IV [Limnochorda sp. L945t]WRP16469.1 deoxyribonuclease IV [Limnochorda sp. L945t]